MRVPAVLERYCLSICSGDFNEWIWKNVSLDYPYTYMFAGEYEMFEFNTASPEAFIDAAHRLEQPCRLLRCGERWSSSELSTTAERN